MQTWKNFCVFHTGLKNWWLSEFLFARTLFYMCWRLLHWNLSGAAYAYFVQYSTQVKATYGVGFTDVISISLLEFLSFTLYTNTFWFLYQLVKWYVGNNLNSFFLFILQSFNIFLIVNLQNSAQYHWIRGQAMLKLYVLMAMVVRNQYVCKMTINTWRCNSPCCII